MFIGSSSAGPVISMDLYECLKGSNLKRELSLPGRAGSVGELEGWLALGEYVRFGDKNKKRKKKSSASAHSAPSIHMGTQVSQVFESGASLTALSAWFHGLRPRAGMGMDLAAS